MARYFHHQICIFNLQSTSMVRIWLKYPWRNQSIVRSLVYQSIVRSLVYSPSHPGLLAFSIKSCLLDKGKKPWVRGCYSLFHCNGIWRWFFQVYIHGLFKVNKIKWNEGSDFEAVSKNLLKHNKRLYHDPSQNFILRREILN